VLARTPRTRQVGASARVLCLAKAKDQQKRTATVHDKAERIISDVLAKLSDPGFARARMLMSWF